MSSNLTTATISKDRMPRYRRQQGPPRDHLGSVIEVGDTYFYGAPPTIGKVVKITGSSIVLEYVKKNQVWSQYKQQYVASPDTKETMTCRSPEKGLCIDKT